MPVRFLMRTCVRSTYVYFTCVHYIVPIQNVYLYFGQSPHTPVLPTKLLLVLVTEMPANITEYKKTVHERNNNNRAFSDFWFVKMFAHGNRRIIIVLTSKQARAAFVTKRTEFIFSGQLSISIYQ